jgi:O-methyltransferase
MVNKILKYFGYALNRIDFHSVYPDIEHDFINMASLCSPYTMTSVERMYSIFKCVEYIIKSNIVGDFVECGVWKGGSAMMMAYTLLNLNTTDRTIYLYDTFEGMPEPSENDINLNHKSAKKIYLSKKNSENGSNWLRSELEDVKNNLYATGYPKDKIILVKGKVEQTIPSTGPEKIALLRLDTDWYESTKHELQHLYPILSERGVLIIDDYGHWLGCKQAVDEYVSENNINILLNRIDYTGRLGIK